MAVQLTALSAISPIDGRYADKTQGLREIYSEYGLIRYRLIVEIRWLQALAAEPRITGIGPFPDATNAFLEQVISDFDMAQAEQVKAIEATIHHDVKAVEYYLRNKISSFDKLVAAREFIHFALTSEDINNLAYAQMLRAARADHLLPAIDSLITATGDLAQAHADIAMLARTHGQAASPTTLGKEMAVFAQRLARQRDLLAEVRLSGKMNGAVGNYNAHYAAYPEADWPDIAARFIEELGLAVSPATTQIEPHDFIAEYCHALMRVNTVLIDFARDVWGYISLGYFKQAAVEGEIGSSTMPHKVNPIDFENAEGNFAVANALARHLAATLPISRMQRDLTDSTTQRVLGTVFGHTLVALTSLAKGLGKLEVAHDRIASELDNHWEVLGEAAQTLMRKHGVDKPYETLKAATRGKALDHATWQAVVAELPLPEAARRELEALTPGTYTGLAAKLTRTRDHA